MLSSLIIVFREVLEAALIVGVLLAATRGLCHRGRFVAAGCSAGVMGSALVALFTEAISGAIEGMGQELFSATILLLAAIMIGWHVVWMKRHAAHTVRHFKQVGQEVCEGKAPLYALSVVAAVAVLREGSEIVLFLYGLFVSGKPWTSILGGGALGLLAGTVMGALLYLGLIRVPAGKLFSVTSFILVFLAAGMVSQAVGFLSIIGWLPTFADPLWDLSGVLSEHSVFGVILNALIGYTSRPTGMQVISYGLTIGGMFMLLQWFGMPSKKTAAALVILTVGLLGLSEPAFATKKVYSPHVEFGELELEYRGSYVFDDRDEKDGKQKHKPAIGYGVTPWWFTEVYGEWENHPGAADDDLSYAATEWENRFQISEPGAWFIDTGFMLELEFADGNADHDEVKSVLLLEKELDLWRHRANPFVEYKYGSEEDEEWEAGASWSTTYRMRREFEPGIELHWNYGNVEESHSFDEQEFQLGPVIYGKIGEHFKYDVGYLFGVAEDSPDGELKWIFEFEWHF